MSDMEVLNDICYWIAKIVFYLLVSWPIALWGIVSLIGLFTGSDINKK